MLEGRLVLCWMLGWYLFGREVGTMSDVRLVRFWMFFGCYVGFVWIEVGTISDVRLVFSGCVDWCYVGVRLVVVWI
jgi:hypothetical protein